MYANMFSGGPLYKDEIIDTDDPSNPKVFFDISVGDNEPKRLAFQLFKNIVPKTVENFLTITQGNKSDEKQTYKGSIFHRLIKGFMLQGGDYENRNGTGGRSIWGEKFNDENFKVKHTKRGLLSMANAGPNTNGSQFFITFTPTPHLDGKHVVFGKLIEGQEFLDELEQEPTEPGDKPTREIRVADCGLLE